MYASVGLRQYASMDTERPFLVFIILVQRCNPNERLNWANSCAIGKKNEYVGWIEYHTTVYTPLSFLFIINQSSYCLPSIEYKIKNGNQKGK